MPPIPRAIARSFLPSHRELELIDTTLHRGQYKVIGFLGRGTSGAVVYRVSDQTGEHAAKRIDTRLDALEWTSKNEHILHTYVSEHPHVLTCHGSFVDRHYSHLLTGVCEGGRLADFIDESTLFWRSDETIRRVFLSIISAVRHCHARGVAHRDINPENVLALDAAGKTFLLSDFGKATTEKKSRQFGLGIEAYTAPECLAGGPSTSYDTRTADVWSLGVLLLNMVTGGIAPWPAARASHPAYVSFLSEPVHLQRILPVSSELVVLLARVLEPRPKRRATLAEFERAVMCMGAFSMSDAELALEHRSVARGRVELRARLLGVPWKPLATSSLSDTASNLNGSSSRSSFGSPSSSHDDHWEKGPAATLRRLSSLRSRMRPSSMSLKSRLSFSA